MINTKKQVIERDTNEKDVILNRGDFDLMVVFRKRIDKNTEADISGPAWDFICSILGIYDEMDQIIIPANVIDAVGVSNMPSSNND